MPTTQLVPFLKSQADGSLRGVIEYDSSSVQVRYLRGDIRKTRMRSQVDRMLRRLEPETDSEEEESFPFGQLHVTVRRFEEAIIMHFPLAKEHGIVVALETDTARELNQFTSACLNRIQSAE